jgi:hypothetical protein
MTAKKPHSDRDRKQSTRRTEEQEQDAELEKALEDTFPSSDPVSLTQPTIASKKKKRH